MIDLKDTNVILTGATGGIGNSILENLIITGANVLATGTNEDKLNLIQDILASKEMYLGRHYIKKGKWVAAINRFKNVTQKYDQTIFIEEALHRLVEVNYKVGLLEESRKYANLLGYNYQSSEWYKKSYKVFNQDYDLKLKKINKGEKKGIIKKFKKLFD